MSKTLEVIIIDAVDLPSVESDGLGLYIFCFILIPLRYYIKYSTD
jgi:hypothetical protein